MFIRSKPRSRCPAFPPFFIITIIQFSKSVLSFPSSVIFEIVSKLREEGSIEIRFRKFRTELKRAGRDARVILEEHCRDRDELIGNPR